jgi:hypothetical protein
MTEEVQMAGIITSALLMFAVCIAIGGNACERAGNRNLAHQRQVYSEAFTKCVAAGRTPLECKAGLAP